MVTKSKKTRIKEADQIVDQNVAPVAASPATPADIAQAPVQSTEVPVEPIQELVTEETMSEPVENDVKVNPETVSLEMQIPTDQLASAVAQATGDVVPAETAPDVMEAKSEELAGEEPLVADEDMSMQTAPMTDPGMGQTATTQPVTESLMREHKKAVEGRDYIVLDRRNGYTAYQPLTHVGSTKLCTNRTAPEIYLEPDSFMFEREPVTHTKWGISIKQNWNKYTAAGFQFIFLFREDSNLPDTEKKIAYAIKDGEVKAVYDAEDREYKNAPDVSYLIPKLKNTNFTESLMREGVDALDVESQKVEKKMEDDLERIIKAGVNNTAKGLSNGKAGISSDKVHNRADIIDKASEQMNESDETVRKIGEAEIDNISNIINDEEVVSQEDDIIEEEVNEEVGNENLPTEFAPAESDDDIDAMFDSAPDSEELLNKIEDFVNSEETSPEDVSDALRTAAAFLDQIADDKKFKFEDVIGDDYSDSDEEDLSDEEDVDFDSDDSDLSNYVDSDDDIFEDDSDDEDYNYRMVREPEREQNMRDLPENRRYNGRVRVKESRRFTNPIITERHSLKESSIIYPAGSAPLRTNNFEDDLVARQERVNEARRRAIQSYRANRMEESNRCSRSRFNEALRDSVRSRRDVEEIDSNSWEANTFIDKYEESSKLNYKDLLRNGFLG